MEKELRTFVSEAELEMACKVDILKKFRYNSVKMELPGDNGWPDQLFFAGHGDSDHFFFVEFKDYGKKADPLQLDNHKTLREFGCRVYVCDRWSVWLEILDAEFYT